MLGIKVKEVDFQIISFSGENDPIFAIIGILLICILQISGVAFPPGNCLFAHS